MPFIVTASRSGMHLSGEYAPSRRAVATLEERRVFDATEWGGRDAGDNSQFFHPALILRRYTPLHGMEVATVLFLHNGRVSSGHFTHAMLAPDVPLIPESGGTVGPLPDGTIIEVEHVDWRQMPGLAGIGGNERELLAAFNAREATR